MQLSRLNDKRHPSKGDPRRILRAETDLMLSGYLYSELHRHMKRIDGIRQRRK